ncbi:MAG TPA: hypothetical protein VGV89_01485 [Thermoplasmata archaeon]|nr:hypothetical protein [Thermoplasmata archaeon]
MSFSGDPEQTAELILEIESPVLRCDECCWTPLSGLSHPHYHATFQLGRLRGAVRLLPITGVITQRNSALLRLRTEAERRWKNRSSGHL